MVSLNKTEVFSARDDWRNHVSTTSGGDGTGGGSPTTGDGGKNSAVVCMSSELLNDWRGLYRKHHNVYRMFYFLTILSCIPKQSISI